MARDITHLADSGLDDHHNIWTDQSINRLNTLNMESKVVGIKTEEFLKETILNVVAKKYKYHEDSLEYLKDTKEQLQSVMSFVDETIGYMKTKSRIKKNEELKRQKYLSKPSLVKDSGTIRGNA